MAIILTNPHSAAAMKNLFEFVWQNASIPTLSTAGVRYE
jgi:hypothetical protein